MIGRMVEWKGSLLAALPGLVQPLKRYFPWGDARQYPNLFAMLAGRAGESMRLNNDRGSG
jgi:hypothetical protein